MTKAAVVMLAFFLAVAAAAVVSTPSRHSRQDTVAETADENPKAEEMDAVKDKSTLTDIVQSIGDSVSHATGQAAAVTGQIFNSAFGGLGGIFQAIESILSGKPVVATSTNEDGSGSVVFLVHSQPKQ